MSITETDRLSMVRHPTPLGELTLAASDEAVVYCGFDDPAQVLHRLESAEPKGTVGRTPARHALLDEARCQLDAYLSAGRRTFDLPVDLGLASGFVRQTVTTLAEFTPYGRTATYGALAARLNRAGAARAVGRALGANPLCVILPCHRIVPASGGPGGYAGGTEAKRFLLTLEARDVT
ncbi:methylated-DNA--[protein]-cysteine S-methyltransferase [Kitasatospora sp. NPDC059648]|uniref:methylated-DNA--[protein]-cysteine S-methyltransferase n=1 Tax=Kitasatospora sp. NPDC059648 TaxID=3346894 RepID=UPI00369CA494